MFRVFISFVICFLVVCKLSSQVEDSNIQQSKNNYLIIQLRPTSILSFNTPRIGLALEYRISKQSAFSFDFGLANSSLNFEPGYNFLELRPEIKLFFKKRDSRYVSAEFFFVEYSKFKQGGYILRPLNDGGDISIDSADYRKVKYGCHIKLGSKLEFNKYLELDGFFGLGFTYRMSEFDNVIPSDINSIPPETFNRESRELDGFAPHATIGLKLGFITFR